MRNQLLSLALVSLVPAAALAQRVDVIPPASLATGPTRVQLYGVLDIGLETARMGDYTTTRVNSGQSAGSRVGLRGSEDMGGGYRTIFELEMRLEVDTGFNTTTSPFVSRDLPVGTFPATAPGPLVAPGSPAYNATVAAQQQLQRTLTTVNARGQGLFDRQSMLGVVTPFGALLIGRLYTPGYEVLNAYNVFGDASVGQFGQNYALLNIRANNALAYRARFLDHLSFTAMYSLGGNETQLFGRDERTTSPRAADHFYGANLRWTTETYDVGIGYNRNNTIDLVNNSAVKGLETLNVGASMKLGPTRIYAQFMKRKNDNPVFEGLPTVFNLAQFNAAAPYLSFQDADATVGQAGKTNMYAYHLGIGWRVAPNNTIAVAFNRGDDRRTLNADVNHFAIGYSLDLSRSTIFYAAYAYLHNSPNARSGINSAGYSGGFVSTSGFSPSVLQAGLRTTF